MHFNVSLGKINDIRGSWLEKHMLFSSKILMRMLKTGEGL